VVFAGASFLILFGGTTLVEGLALSLEVTGAVVFAGEGAGAETVAGVLAAVEGGGTAAGEGITFMVVLSV